MLGSRSCHGRLGDDPQSQEAVHGQHIGPSSYDVADGVDHPPGSGQVALRRLRERREVIGRVGHQGIDRGRDGWEVLAGLLDGPGARDGGQLAGLLVGVVGEDVGQSMLAVDHRLDEGQGHLRSGVVREERPTGGQAGELEHRVVAARKAEVEQIAECDGLEHRVAGLVGAPRHGRPVALLAPHVHRDGRLQARKDGDDAIARVEAGREPQGLARRLGRDERFGPLDHRRMGPAQEQRRDLGHRGDRRQCARVRKYPQQAVCAEDGHVTRTELGQPGINLTRHRTTSDQSPRHGGRGRDRRSASMALSTCTTSVRPGGVIGEPSAVIRRFASGSRRRHRK